ncbi:hypothetical protein LOTGIDRAFT_160410 [Lottia gigantea]|uniref:C-type lectin domain-containing protein n=1 Tax=Lottia gigantea TaxID=225164 RepID=V4AKM5_LOTGI|nr:hypothetical protein LOTGIDRAFT_160410 [Lottia gigantea]ESO95290.1 hypothetical protein LOTGIDRAFT_160410 [Lottia gigantea]
MNLILVTICAILLTQVYGDDIYGEVTCDNIGEFFVDGQVVASSNDWKVGSQVSFPDTAHVLAFDCLDEGGIGGIRGSFSSGMVTDSAWKCSTSDDEGWSGLGFDDSEWQNATIQTHSQWGNEPTSISSEAKWIWTAGDTADRHVFCRRRLRSVNGNGIYGEVTCDNIGEFFVDGQLVASSNDWRVGFPVVFPARAQVLAFDCLDEGVIGGIRGSFSNGMVTDSAWKCSTSDDDGWRELRFDDSEWQNATIQTHSQWGNEPTSISSEAKWIWTAGDTADRHVFCRRRLRSATSKKVKTFESVQ